MFVLIACFITLHRNSL